MVQKAIEKAAALIEALPYIQHFRGETVVVKFGGSILDNRKTYEHILRDVAFMEVIGMRPVLVHGGGKAISQRMKEAGLAAKFIQGLRVSDAPTIDIVEQVLNHEVNPALVATLQESCKAAGIHGNDIIQVEKHTGSDKDGNPIDWEFVGNVTHVDVQSLNSLLDDSTVPVITPLGRGADGQTYNVNADEAAGAVAREIHARKLVFLSDVPGIMADLEDPDSIISSLHLHEVEELINRGIIAGGMMPKVSGAIKAIQAGVKKIHIIDAAMPHSLLLELFTDKGVGTEILA
ncbi:MAG: acetylglutamate kinase [Candidatus Omnitrophota bacterium]